MQTDEESVSIVKSDGMQEPSKRMAKHQGDELVRTRAEDADWFMRQTRRYATDYVKGDIQELPTLQFGGANQSFRSHSAPSGRRDMCTHGGHWLATGKTDSNSGAANAATQVRAQPILTNVAFIRRDSRASAHTAFVTMHLARMARAHAYAAEGGTCGGIKVHNVRAVTSEDSLLSEWI